MAGPVQVPFAELLGLELLQVAEGEAQMALTPGAALANAFGVVHGGVTMSLLDAAMAHAARGPALVGQGVVTLEMKTSFMRAAEGRLLADARVLHRTASLAFCEATVCNAAGALLAQGTGTYQFIRALPLGARRTRALNVA